MLIYLSKTYRDKNSQEGYLSTCIQLLIIKHPSRKVQNFRHFLGCDTIEPLGLGILVLRIRIKYTTGQNQLTTM